MELLLALLMLILGCSDDVTMLDDGTPGPPPKH